MKDFHLIMIPVTDHKKLLLSKGYYALSYFFTPYVVEDPSGITWPIEIKSSDHVTKDDYRSLINFAQDFPKAKLLVLSRDKIHRVTENVEIIHFKEGLRKVFY